MSAFDFKIIVPSANWAPATAFLFGADSQNASVPSLYTGAAISAGLFGEVSGDAVISAGGVLTITNPLLTGLKAANVQNISYIFALGDAGGIVEHNDAIAGYIYTIPAHSAVAWSITSTPHIKILNNSSATLSVAPAGGVTLTRADGTSGAGTRTLGANSSALIYAIAQDSWIIEGSSLT